MNSQSFNHTPAPAPAMQPLFRIDLKQSLRRHKVLARSVAIAIMLLTGILIARRKPFNYAEAVVFVSPAKFTASGENFSGPAYELLLLQEMQLVTERQTLALALKQPELANFRRPNETEAAAVTRLQGQVFVGRVDQTFRFSISMEDKDHNIVAGKVNAVTRAFLQRAREIEANDSAERLASLTKQRQDLEQRLNDTLTQQSAINKRMGVAVTDGLGTNQFDLETQTLRSQLLQAQSQRETAQSNLAGISGSSGTAALAASADEAVANDAGLTGLKNSLSQRRAALIQQMVGMSPSNPLFKQNQDELKKLDDATDQLHTSLQQQATRRLQDKARGELQRSQSLESDLLTRLAMKQTQAGNASQSLQAAIGMGQDIQRLRAQYALLDSRITTIDADATGPPTVRLVESAVTPTSPLSDKNKKLLMILFILAIPFGVFAAVLANAVDPRVHKSSDVTHIAGFGVMGVLLDHHDFNKKISDEYNFRLAGALEDAVRCNGSKVFLVTGDAPEVGTSEAMREIGRTLASFGHRVLAMDSSGRTPAVAYASSSRGDEIQPYGGRTDIERRVATNGKDNNLITGMLERYLQTYEIILIDSAPILSSADTEYLARVVDGTVLVVGCGISKKRNIQRSLDLFAKLGVTQVGIVLARIGADCADADLAADIASLQERVERKPLNTKWLKEQIAHSMKVEEVEMHTDGALSPEIQQGRPA